MSDSSNPIPENSQGESPLNENDRRSDCQTGEQPIQATESSQGKSETSQLQEDLQDANDRALRAQADLENYRKRIQREMDEGRKYANVALIRDLLPVIDNLERAITSAEKTEENAGLLTGVEMVVSHFFSALQKHHCEKIESIGTLFDPNLHEAISQQFSDQYPENTVLHEALSGYTIIDRVVRPSQVVVSTILSPGAPVQAKDDLEENEETEQ